MVRASGVIGVRQQVRIGLNERMRRRLGRTRSLVAALGAVALLMTGAVVAQTPDPTGTPGTPGLSASPEVATTVNATLGEIEWAREIDPATNAPLRRATGFVTIDPAIHAVIPVMRIVQGTVVSAEWSFNGEHVPALDTSVTAASSYENGWLAFSLTRPGDQIWPIGAYGITIFVDGVELLSAEVRVDVPPA